MKDFSNEEAFSIYAQDNNLIYANSTCDRTGYPSHVQPCLIGFDTYEDAVNAATELSEDCGCGVAVMHLEKRDGWNLWHRRGIADGPYDIRDIEGYDCVIYDERDRFIMDYHDDDVWEYAIGVTREV